MDDLFEQLFERHPDAWAIVELREERIVILRANAALAARFRLSQKAFVAADLRDLMPEHEFVARREALRIVAANGVGQTFDFDGGRPERGPARATILPIDMKEPGAPRFIVQLRDEAERKKAESELMQSEERLGLALESADLYSWSLDLATGRSHVDPRWAAHLGYTLDDFASQEQTRRMVHPADRQQTFAAFNEHFEGRSPKIFATYRHSTSDGSWRWVEVHARVIVRDASGAPRTLVGVCRDVTEMRRLEQRVAVAERMASLGTLAAGVGHEINNPLTYLTANLALLEDALVTHADDLARDRQSLEALLSMLADARDGAARIVRIVRDLKTLSRADAAPPRAVDITFVLERCLVLADHEIRHRARVERDFASVPAVFGEEGKLMQVVLNLLVNAAQSIPEGAVESNTIRVSLRSADSRVLIEISDSGAGMTADVIAAAFDPFFTTKHANGGTGLGLSICHSIVTDMGGTIDVDSTPGAGSTFRVRLPAAAPAEHEARGPARTSTPPSGALRILVLDDEETVGRLLVRVLDEHEVVVETRAANALERIRAGEQFDRILCDIMMPHMSGIDFFEALSSLKADLAPKVIFMSGGAFSPRATSFLATVANRAISKPFDPAEVRSIVLRSPPRTER